MRSVQIDKETNWNALRCRLHRSQIPQKGFVRSYNTRRRTGRDQFIRWRSINHAFDILERITTFIYLEDVFGPTRSRLYLYWHQWVIRTMKLFWFISMATESFNNNNEDMERNKFQESMGWNKSFRQSAPRGANWNLTWFNAWVVILRNQLYKW